MKFEDLINKSGEWLKGEGAYSEVVISSRIRLARNISKIPFPHWAKKTNRERILSLIQAAAVKCPSLKRGLFIRLDQLSLLDRQFLAERHLISHEQIRDNKERAVIIGEKEIAGVMINEEDHLRLQIIFSGLELQEAWRISNKIDGELEKNLDYAFSPKWGYLTACPTNTGTGLRASVLMHLPALAVSRDINRLLQAVAKLGLAVRGLYGEGTQATGNYFQISNQICLGRTEEELIENIDRVIKQIIEYEQNAKKVVLNKSRSEIHDKVFRALGILKNARLITSQETIGLLSTIRLGLALGIISEKEVERRKINELFIITQPAHLQKMGKKELNPMERDEKRALLIREKLAHI
ncbi:MAG: protein arginine kinase [Candidatus Ratteibacteria bacterium]|nr:protein arginine kinase [Candidatus Ratteibacteria bacterium]